MSSTLRSRLVETNAGYITDRGSRECWSPRECPEISQMLPQTKAQSVLFVKLKYKNFKTIFV